MAAIATLVDDFDDNVVDGARWPGNYGTYSETGGRARVSCGTGYSAFESASTYTLAGSSVYARVYPPAAGGATAEAYALIAILSPTDGTAISTLINRATGVIRFQSNVAFWDDNVVQLTYDTTNHAWVKIAEAGGTVTWSTSANGTTWATRRTLATPAWVTSGNTLTLNMEAHRDGGTVDFAEFDNVNTLGGTPPSGPSAAVMGAFLAFL